MIDATRLLPQVSVFDNAGGASLRVWLPRPNAAWILRQRTASPSPSPSSCPLELHQSRIRQLSTPVHGGP